MPDAGCRRQVSGIWHPKSGIRHLASGIPNSSDERTSKQLKQGREAFCAFVAAGQRLGQVVQVSLETLKLMRELPELMFP